MFTNNDYFNNFINIYLYIVPSDLAIYRVCIYRVLESFYWWRTSQFMPTNNIVLKKRIKICMKIVFLYLVLKMQGFIQDSHKHLTNRALQQ